MYLGKLRVVHVHNVPSASLIAEVARVSKQANVRCSVPNDDDDEFQFSPPSL